MTSRGLFWGILFITLGVVFLGQELGWFSLDWSLFSRFWPLLIILAGLNLIFARRNNAAAVITTVLLAVAAPIALVSAFRSHNHGRGDRFDYRYDRDEDNREEEEMEESEAEEDVREPKVRSNHIAEPMDAGIEQASLKFESGAGRFYIGSPSDSLIEADTRMSVSSYSMSVNRDDEKRITDIELKLDDEDIKLKSGELVNRVDVRLNPLPVWTFDFAVGAGQADFDLSQYNTKSVTMSAGAADVDLKLGDKAPLSNLKIEAGMASVTLKIPKGVGCQVETEGALNVKKLDGFDEIGNGIYQTAGYGSAARKITIRYEGGMSRFRVERY